MSRFLPVCLTAAAYALIAIAHLFECAVRAPRAEVHHWAVAAAYTVLGLLAVVALIRFIRTANRPDDRDEPGAH